MKKLSNMVWGAVLIAAGVIFALNELGLTDVELLFDGWWTLFIIIPCTVGLFTEREKSANAVGLIIGVLLLLAAQGIMEFSVIWKLALPIVIIAIGIKLIVDSTTSKSNVVFEEMKAEGKTPHTSCAAFSGCDVKLDGEVFEGAELTAVFGGIKYDLRGAVIEKDAAIKICAVFGGIDVFVPDNVKVKLNTTSIFGGASDKTASKAEGDDAVTLYVSGICLFGGADIK